MRAGGRGRGRERSNEAYGCCRSGCFRRGRGIHGKVSPSTDQGNTCTVLRASVRISRGCMYLFDLPSVFGVAVV